MTAANGIRQLVRVPECVRRELLSYAEREGIERGPLFVTRSGKPMARTNVTAGILQLGDAAHVEREKANPRCLRKLYQTMRAGIEANMSLLVEQAMERQLEQEQLGFGWEACGR